jgi:quercetin dioxygenase-like cupin family protein
MRKPCDLRLQLRRTSRILDNFCRSLAQIGIGCAYRVGAAAHGDRNTLQGRGIAREDASNDPYLARALARPGREGDRDLPLLYEIRVAELVPEPHHPDPIIVRADDRQVLRYSAEEIDVEVLVPDGPHTMQALLATFAPRARMLDYVPQPNEQFTHVIEGRVRTEFADGREIELETGDSATYVSGDGGHRHTNLADDVARMLIVVRRPRVVN